MSTAITERPTAPLAVTSEQLELVKRTVANGATDAELKLYLYDCARHGVHPLDKLLHFTKRGGKYTPVTSIDLMRMRAADTGEMAGNDDPVFAHDENDALAASVTVYRLTQGQRFAYSATARWTEYFPGDAQGHMWKKMPHTMLGKCAEALALRKGFPKQLAGLYAREEMEQAERTAAPASPSAVEPSTVQTPQGEAVNAVTGEVVPDDGQLRIVRVDPRPTQTGKPRWYVVFSDGIEACTFKVQESALAEQLCQEQAAVRAERIAGNWGHDLKGLKRAPVAPSERPPAPDPPHAITGDDIPF
jgi:phage recombination protein Bet